MDLKKRYNIGDVVKYSDRAVQERFGCMGSLVPLATLHDWGFKNGDSYEVVDVNEHGEELFLTLKTSPNNTRRINSTFVIPEDQETLPLRKPRIDRVYRNLDKTIGAVSYCF